MTYAPRHQGIFHALNHLLIRILLIYCAWRVVNFLIRSLITAVAVVPIFFVALWKAINGESLNRVVATGDRLIIWWVSGLYPDYAKKAPTTRAQRRVELARPFVANQPLGSLGEEAAKRRAERIANNGPWPQNWWEW